MWHAWQPEVTAHRIEPLRLRAIAHIVHQRPRTVERSRPEIVRIPRDHIARGMADPAADAFDAFVRGPALVAFRLHHREIVGDRIARLEEPARRLPFVEERRHVDREVLHHLEVAQRFELERAIARNRIGHARAARPARAPVDHHRARSAHPHAAGEAIGERRILLALDLGDDVEHGLVGAPRHGEGLEPAGLCPSPHLDVKHRVRGLCSAA